MLPIAVGIVVGGTALVGVATIAQKRNKPRLLDVLNGNVVIGEDKAFGEKLTETVSRQSPLLGKWLVNTGSLLMKVDAHYQKLITQRIDPLLAGKNRQQFFKTLAADREIVLSPDQKALNRKLLLGYTSLKIIAVGYVLGVSFAPIVLAIGLYLSFPVYKAAYEIAVEERRLSTIHLLVIYFTTLWVAGYYAIGTLSFLLAVITQKVMRICDDASRYEQINVFYQQPRSVWILREETEIEIPFEQLQVGDILVLDVGQTIPIDGVIVNGLASIDQHILTGESSLIDKAPGDTVLAATMVLAGRIFVQVAKTGQETSAAQIGEILNRSSKHQLSMEARSMKIADRTLIPMLITSAVTFPFIGLGGAVAVLGSNFTMNMVWLRLLTLLNFLNLASKHKILIKEAEALERLKNTDTIVFDKTGTLTSGLPHLLHVHTCDEWRDDDIVMLAAAAEHRQLHPVALAILAAAAERQLVLPHVDDAQYKLGFGIKVRLQEQWICVGSRQFLNAENISVSADMQALESIGSEQGHSLVYVAVEGQLAGLIELKASTRPEALEIVSNLHDRGLKLYIISGDSEQPTKALAEELGIDGYFANTLPEGKANLIKQLQAEGRNVCFIGDGINDAIALRQADVSISLNGASTAATDTAQIVLMDADLKQLLTLLDLAYALDDNIDRNFRRSIIMSLVSVSGILFFHAGFLMVEILAALQAFQGIAIASQPLLNQPDDQSSLTKLSALPSQDK